MRGPAWKRSAERFLAPLALVVLVLVAYHEAPDNGFHLDDFKSISENPAIRVDDLSVDALAGAAAGGYVPNRPLPYLTFAIDWWRGGGEPRSFLWTNVVLHALNAVAVFALFALLLRGRPDIDRASRRVAATAAAAMWAAHPIQTQGVTYVTQRMAELAALFVLLSVVAYLLGRRAPTRRRSAVLFSLAALAALAGGVSKETAWVLPLLIAMVELGVVRRDGPLLRNRVEVAVLAGVVGLGLLVFVSVLAGVGPLAGVFEAEYAQRSFTMGERVLTQPRVVLFHVSQLLWPMPGRFSLEHDFATSTSLVDPATTLPALVAVVAWCAAAAWLAARTRQRDCALLMLWVPATLFLESSVVPLEMVFEHRMYLPTVGLFGLAAIGLAHVARRGRRERALVAAGSVIVVALLALSTIQRVPDWRTQVTLAEASVRNAPNEARPWADLGVGYYRQGRKAKAEAALRRALMLNEDSAMAHEFLGLVLFDRGELDAAARHLRIAVRLDRENSSAANHLGEVLLQRGAPAAAERLFARAQQGSPWIAAYYWNRALALEELGDCARARAQWGEFLEREKDGAARSQVVQHLRIEHDSPGGRCAK